MRMLRRTVASQPGHSPFWKSVNDLRRDTIILTEDTQLCGGVAMQVGRMIQLRRPGQPNSTLTRSVAYPTITLLGRPPSLA